VNGKLAQPGEPRVPAVNEARKAGLSGFVGTTIEWFDFGIYATASALVLGRIFFAGASPVVGTLAAFGTFWVGFLARPVGGLIFGHFGDRFGRKGALVATLSIMGTATFCVGLLPTYAQIGATAPVLLIVLRMVQGIAMGGEWGGAVLIGTEHAPPGKKILYGAFAQQGSPVGNLLATLAFLAVSRLPDRAFETWGWRLPFLASAVLVLVGLYVRLRLKETPEMRRLIDGRRVSRLPIKDIVTRYPRLVALAVGAATAGVALTYVKTTFALSWATTDLDFSRSSFLTVIAIATAAQIFVQPFGAVLATRMDLKRAISLILLPELVLLPLMFVLISTGSFAWAVVGMCLATFPHTMYYAALAGVLAQLFPPEVRYTGVSLSYQLSTMIFAGTAPIVSQFLLARTGAIWPVVALGLVYVLLTLVCVFALIRRGLGRQAAVTARSTPTHT